MKMCGGSGVDAIYSKIHPDNRQLHSNVAMLNVQSKFQPKSALKIILMVTAPKNWFLFIKSSSAGKTVGKFYTLGTALMQCAFRINRELSHIYIGKKGAGRM